MAIKLNKEESLFRNELIFTADAKAVNIDNTLVNLFMLLKYNGIRPKQRARSSGSTFIELDTLKKVFSKLEEEGSLKGFKDNPDAAELWMRSNLVNMVFRGNVDKEKISSLRPIHLESYRVRNAANTRDYNTADQVYLMLGANPTVKEDLKNFLMEGWDQTTSKINNGNGLDVDSLGLLHIIKKVKPGFLESNSTLNQIHPILQKQAELFCDDVRRLLVYKRLIPRNVLIDYLKTIISFHLSLYIQKLVHFLPKMVESGNIEIIDDWNIVLDATDNYASKVSRLAAADAESLTNKIYDYVKSTFQVNAALRRLKLDKTNSENLTKALKILQKKPTDFEIYFETQWDNLYNSLEEEDKLLIEDMVKYEDTYFDRYIELILKARGTYQYRFHIQLIDNLSQKNNERGFMAQGRSRKHPRRFVLGTRLLETLVQILVLESRNNQFQTRSLSIEELVSNIRERYGLVINGLNEERFADADLQTHLAFKENMEAFKMKLRQIGFYNDLSDAYILQRIRPRYELNVQ
ncbi:methylation-associated defense system protein MAD7 [Sinomicrobium weinanense]|uniref:Uncharacterized protein n=1 Tax=Sinomicrobium weinanense TaxID=2842200 RepID=A0A926Q361_9FLAO|nr:hypothetical protein [Sinomicrobium weinanense]MBC9795415.1 hypothetical protein [Sinomicrobium weinanense]MBU3123940.1 hypothetical protein [Sinomicrobium weinanense]